MLTFRGALLVCIITFPVAFIVCLLIYSLFGYFLIIFLLRFILKRLHSRLTGNSLQIYFDD